MKIFLFAVCAGTLGTACRFLLMRFINHSFHGFPYGTLAVNVIGAFAAGFLFMTFRDGLRQYDKYMPILLVGFLGAFTTFSTYALESARIIMHGQYVKGLLNIGLQNVVGIGAAWLGMVWAKLLFR